MGEGVEFADLSGVDGRFNGAELFGNIVKTFTLPNLWLGASLFYRAVILLIKEFPN